MPSSQINSESIEGEGCRERAREREREREREGGGSVTRPNLSSVPLNFNVSKFSRRNESYLLACCALVGIVRTGSACIGTMSEIPFCSICTPVSSCAKAFACSIRLESLVLPQTRGPEALL